MAGEAYNHMGMRFFIALAFLVALSSTAQSQRPEVRVIDGDTVEIDGERIRIANIDTPELRGAKCEAEYRLAKIAARRVEELLELHRIRIRRGDPKDGRLKDRYGRTLAIIYVDGVDLGEILIEEDLAQRWYSDRVPWCG
ncbi:thermonuclease family protein [Hoeflea sp. TYP-13]|uniref:thermonuclease family protein n=1 Tax=Hoeflea sp. TYP-13 TaxID=3230023 RepID=UPI0034C5EAA4